MDPHGYAVPLGSHIRRMKPPRHGAQHEPAPNDPPRGDVGPPLPEGAPEDGAERGIAAFVICASLIRQFEFAQNVWVNDRNFTNSATSAIRSSATRTGRWSNKIPKRPIRKKIAGFPPSPPSEAARTSFSPASRRFGTSRHCTETDQLPVRGWGRLMDILVVGAGPAGVLPRCARRNSARGRLFVTRDEFGGMAANDGPVPVRTLAHAARLMRDARQLGQYGISMSEPTLDYPDCWRVCAKSSAMRARTPLCASRSTPGSDGT